MNPSVIHRDAEYRAKEHLRTQYISHRTSIDSYEIPEVAEYDRALYELTHRVGKYIISVEGDQRYRDYITTTTADW